MIDLNSPRAVIDWQRRCAAKQPVFVVVDSMGEQASGNLYDSSEAAQLEVDWLHARERRRYRVSCIGRLRNLELSKEKWT